MPSAPDRGPTLWLDDLCRQQIENGMLDVLIVDHRIVARTATPPSCEHVICKTRYCEEMIRGCARYREVAEASTEGARTLGQADLRRAQEAVRGRRPIAIIERRGRHR